MVAELVGLYELRLGWIYEVVESVCLDFPGGARITTSGRLALNNLDDGKIIKTHGFDGLYFKKHSKFRLLKEETALVLLRKQKELEGDIKSLGLDARTLRKVKKRVK